MKIRSFCIYKDKLYGVTGRHLLNPLEHPVNLAIVSASLHVNVVQRH